MQATILSIVLAALLASSGAMASAIKGAPTKSGGLKGPLEYSPAAKGRLVQVASPVAPPVLSQVVRHSAVQPVSVENRDWLIKQEQILQQQHESLDTIQRDLKQSEEQSRLEQNRLVDEQHLLEPAQPLAAPTKGGEHAFVRPARLETSGKTSQAKLEAGETKGGWTQSIKQEREEQKLEPIIQQEQQQIEQQQIEQLPLGQKLEGAEAEPYSFAYNIDGQARGESGDKRGVVRGYYRLASGDGQDRLVEYIADQQGFRAVVRTNEFGTEARSPAHVALHSSQPLAEEIARSSGFVQESVKGQRLAPVAPLLVQSPVPVEHAPIPLPVQPRPPVVVQAPPVPLVREESKSPVEQSPRQEHELDDQVQLVRSNTEQRGGKSLEVVRSAPSVERSFSSATAHRSPTVQASPVSHRSPKAEVSRYSTFKANSYNSEDSPNAGFEHPLDN